MYYRFVDCIRLFCCCFLLLQNDFVTGCRDFLNDEDSPSMSRKNATTSLLTGRVPFAQT